LTDLLERRGPASSGEGQRHRAARLVVVSGLLLIVAAAVARAWLLAGTWFHLDDLVLTNAAARTPLSIDALREPYFGHLMPGGRLAAWAAVQGGPYDYTWAGVIVILMFVACGLAMLHLLITLFGARPGVLALLTYFLFTPLLAPATLWWSAGINHLPALAATCLAVAAHVRHLRTGSRIDLVATVGWLLAGLFFAELTILAVIPLAVVSLGYYATGTLSQRIAQLWSERRASLVALTVLGAGYLSIYWSLAWESTPSNAKIDWSLFITNASLQTVPTTAVGGPGSWHLAWAAQMEVAPSSLTRLIAFVGVVTIVSLSALTRDRSMRAWLIPLAQLGVCTILVAKSRVLFGPGIALDPRFFAPLALGIPLAIGLAFLPVVDAVESSQVRHRHWFVDRPLPVVAALSAFVAFSLVSASSFPLRHLGADNGDNAESYFGAVAKSLAERDGPVDLVETTVPPFVLGPPEAFYSRALVQFGDRIRFPRVVQDDFYVFTADGRLVRPDLDAVRTARAPEPATCGYRVRSDRSIPLDGPVMGYGWRLRVEYDAEATSSARITIGDVATPVDLRAGAHVLELPGDAEYDAVQVSGVDPTSRVCVSAITVGTLRIPE
jgi:hypothetical protein